MKTPNRGNQDEQFDRNKETFQGRGYHGSQGNMDVYAEDEGYFGGISQFYGDLPEESVDTEEIDREFQVRYDRLINAAKRVLTAEQYRIFDLYFTQHKTQEDVAKIVHTSRAHVTQTCDRVLKILRLYEDEVSEGDITC